MAMTPQEQVDFLQSLVKSGVVDAEKLPQALKVLSLSTGLEKTRIGAEKARFIKLASGEQSVEQIGARSEARIKEIAARTQSKVDLDRLSREVKRQHEEALQASTVKMINDSTNLVYEKLQSLGPGKMPSRDPKVVAQLAQLRTLGDSGKAIADELHKSIVDSESALMTGVANKVLNGAGTAGPEIDSVKLRQLIEDSHYLPNKELRQTATEGVDSLVSAAKETASIRERAAGIISGAEKTGAPQSVIGVLKNSLSQAKTGVEIGAVEAGAPAMIKRAVRVGGLKRAGVGVAAAIAATAIGKALFAPSEKNQELPPAMKMQMLMQMMQAQGKGGGGPTIIESQEEGRQLTNVSKLLGIVDAIRKLSGGAAQSPMPVY